MCIVACAFFLFFFVGAIWDRLHTFRPLVGLEPHGSHQDSQAHRVGHHDLQCGGVFVEEDNAGWCDGVGSVLCLGLVAP